MFGHKTEKTFNGHRYVRWGHGKTKAEAKSIAKRERKKSRHGGARVVKQGKDWSVFVR